MLKKKMINKVIIITLLLAITIGTIGCSSKKNENSGNNENPIVNEEPENNESQTTSPITGLVTDPSLLDRKPLAVMIENAPQARPQSGLLKADIIYEMLAEGGISRFMAIYYTGDAEKVGPVRSARPYYVDRLMEYGAIYAHAGGAYIVKNYIKQNNVPDIEGLQFGRPYFWRDNSRSAPHNYYSNTLELRNLAEKKGYVKTVDIPAYSFLSEGETNSSGSSANSLKIDYNVSPVTWKYNNENNEYLRFYGAKAHRDRESNNQLSAKNIIVQFARTRDTNNYKHHLDIDFIDKGTALLFQNGQVYDLKWEKNSIKDDTKYYFADGNEIKLVPGQTWIEVVRKGGTKVSYPKPQDTDAKKTK